MNDFLSIKMKRNTSSFSEDLLVQVIGTRGGIMGERLNFRLPENEMVERVFVS